MTRNQASLAVAEDLTRAIPGHLTVRTEAPPGWMHDAWEHGGFAGDFATANGQRVIVAALTHRQFADLASTTRLVSTFAFLERLLKRISPLAAISISIGRPWPGCSRRDLPGAPWPI